DGLVRRMHLPVLLVRPGMDPPRPCDDPCFKRIVVPLDGSRLAEGVLDTVVELARLTEARLTLLQVLPPPYFFDTTESTHPAPRDAGMARLREEAGGYLARVTGELAGRGAQATAQVLVDARPAHAIARYAQEAHADLVALATHGRGGATRLLLGSVADKVVRTSPVPVLVLRPGASS
ncbi:MAG TPA: universal stress protein, partial [Longimicrobiales bacterium]